MLANRTSLEVKVVEGFPVTVECDTWPGTFSCEVVGLCKAGAGIGGAPKNRRLLYELTLEAQRRVAESPLSKREIIRRLGSSATQFYRILDQTNYSKSVDQVLFLLGVLECHVEFVVQAKNV